MRQFNERLDPYLQSKVEIIAAFYLELSNNKTYDPVLVTTRINEIKESAIDSYSLTSALKLIDNNLSIELLKLSPNEAQFFQRLNAIKSEFIM